MILYTEPVAISSPGTVVGLKQPIRFVDPTDTLASVAGTSSVGGVTVTATISTDDATYNGENFDATAVIDFSVVAVAGIEDQDGEVQLAYESTLGEKLRYRIPLFVRTRLWAPGPEQPLPTPE